MSTKNLYLLEGSGRRNILMRDLLDRLFRQKRWIFVLFLLWTSGMALYLWLTPPTYEGEIKFLLNNNRAGTVVSSELNNGPIPRDYVDEAAIATEIQLLGNRELLREVVEKCSLAEGQQDAAAERALNRFQRALKVSPVLKANMIKASYASSNPQEVQDVLKQLADGYLNEHVRVHSATGAYEVFDKQASAYGKHLKELQERLTAFHEGRNIVVLAQQRELNMRKVMDLESALKETEAARSANSHKIAMLREQLGGTQPRITTQAKKLPNQYSAERLNTMLVEMENRKTDLLAKYLPQDRLVVELDKQIADTRAALERTNAASSTEETTDVNPLRQSQEAELAKAAVVDAETRAHSASLQQAIGSYRQALATFNQATVADDQLLREIKETEDNFFLYSKKREEARIEEAMDRQKIANVALVEPPRLPALPQPKLSVTMIATWMLGCLLLLGGALATGLNRTAVYTPWELEGITGLPVLASVPRQALSPRTRALIYASILELNS
jgi:uncharacterized protein involved in exopolysaccharide biosynthesis